MKKIAILILGLSLISCDSDDNNNDNTDICHDIYQDLETYRWYLRSEELTDKEIEYYTNEIDVLKVQQKQLGCK